MSWPPITPMSIYYRDRPPDSLSMWRTVHQNNVLPHQFYSMPTILVPPPIWASSSSSQRIVNVPITSSMVQPSHVGGVAAAHAMISHPSIATRSSLSSSQPSLYGHVTTLSPSSATSVSSAAMLSSSPDAVPLRPHSGDQTSLSSSISECNRTEVSRTIIVKSEASQLQPLISSHDQTTSDATSNITTSGIVDHREMRRRARRAIEAEQLAAATAATLIVGETGDDDAPPALEHEPTPPTTPLAASAVPTDHTMHHHHDHNNGDVINDNNGDHHHHNNSSGIGGEPLDNDSHDFASELGVGSIVKQSVQRLAGQSLTFEAIRGLTQSNSPHVIDTSSSSSSKGNSTAKRRFPKRKAKGATAESTDKSSKRKRSNTANTTSNNSVDNMHNDHHHSHSSTSIADITASSSSSLSSSATPKVKRVRKAKSALSSSSSSSRHSGSGSAIFSSSHRSSSPKLPADANQTTLTKYIKSKSSQSQSQSQQSQSSQSSHNGVSSCSNSSNNSNNNNKVVAGDQMLGNILSPSLSAPLSQLSQSSIASTILSPALSSSSSYSAPPLLSSSATCAAIDDDFTDHISSLLSSSSSSSRSSSHNGVAAPKMAAKAKSKAKKSRKVKELPFESLKEFSDYWLNQLTSRYINIGEADGWERFFIWLERAHQTVNDAQAINNTNTNNGHHQQSYDTKSSSSSSSSSPHHGNNDNNGVHVYIAAWWSDASTTFRPSLTADQRKLQLSILKQRSAPLQESAASLLSLEDKVDLDAHRVPLAIIFRCHIARDIQTFVLPIPLLNHYDTKRADFLTEQENVLFGWLCDKSTEKIIFGAKHVLRFLVNYFGCLQLPCQIPIPSLRCAQLAAWMVDPDNHNGTNFDFPPLVAQYKIEAHHIPHDDHHTNDDLPFQLAAFEQDINCLPDVWRSLERHLRDSELYAAFVSQEMGVCALLAMMDAKGIALDVAYFAECRQRVEQRLDELTKTAASMAGHRFLLTSPDQVATVLYEELNLPKVVNHDRGGRKAPTKTHHSTGEAVLKELVKRHALPQVILDHRRLSKALSTYMDPMVRAAVHARPSRYGTPLDDEVKWRIYCSWNQHATGTGRLSSSKPNLQSLPKRQKASVITITPSIPSIPSSLSSTTASVISATPIDFKDDLDDGGDDEESKQLPTFVPVRSAFVCGHANTEFLSADYSQMEMRILAQISDDKALIRLFNDLHSSGSSDVYDLMASACFNLPIDKVSKHDRDKAKTISLGIVYGMGARNMAVQLSQHSNKAMSETAAQELITRWYKQFPGVRAFMIRTKEEAKKHGYVMTMARRRRYLPDIKSSIANERAYAERKSVNTVIQGSASDITKLAMLRIQKAITKNAERRGDDPTRRPRVSLVMQLHDEIVLEVERGSVFDETATWLRTSMEGVVSDAHVPFPVNIKRGRTLGSMVAIPLSSQSSSSLVGVSTRARRDVSLSSTASAPSLSPSRIMTNNNHIASSSSLSSSVATAVVKDTDNDAISISSQPTIHQSSSSSSSSSSSIAMGVIHLDDCDDNDNALAAVVTPPMVPYAPPPPPARPAAPARSCITSSNTSR